jgi:hypothetical protein
LQWLLTARQQSTSNNGDGQGQRNGNATATALTAMVRGAKQRQWTHEKYNNQLAKAAMDGVTAMDGNGRRNRATTMAALEDGR